jgi:hypothetical protein
VDHPLMVKATKPKVRPKTRGKTKNAFNKWRNKESYMVLRVLYKVLHCLLQEGAWSMTTKKSRP